MTILSKIASFLSHRYWLDDIQMTFLFSLHGHSACLRLLTESSSDLLRTSSALQSPIAMINKDIVPQNTIFLRNVYAKTLNLSVADIPLVLY